MDEFAEEIWKERLTAIIDTKKIYDKQSLLKEFEKLSNPEKGMQGNPKAKQQLIKHIKSFLKLRQFNKLAASNIFKETNIRTLKRLSKRRARATRLPAVKQLNKIISFQTKIQLQRTETKTIKEKTYKSSKPRTFTRYQEKWIGQRTSEKNNRLLAMQFSKRYKTTISPEAIKSKKLRLKGTKKT